MATLGAELAADGTTVTFAAPEADPGYRHGLLIGSERMRVRARPTTTTATVSRTAGVVHANGTTVTPFYWSVEEAEIPDPIQDALDAKVDAST